MYPTTLPNAKVNADKNPSIYCPNDQRTTFRIAKSKQNSNPLRELTHAGNNQGSMAHYNHHHLHQINSDGTTTNISESCGKDNSENVMCVLTKNLQKFDFNRSRTKFSVACHVIAWMVFFGAINITFSNPVTIPQNSKCCQVNPTYSNPDEPIVHKSVNCSAEMTHCFNRNSTTHSLFKAIEHNILQTNFTTENLKENFENFFKTTGKTLETFQSFEHYARNITFMFKGPTFLDMFEKILRQMHSELILRVKELNFFICRHNNTNYKKQTIHIMNWEHDPKINDNISSILADIRHYANQSFVIINDTLWDLGLNSTLREPEDNCTCMGESLSLPNEFILIRRLQKLLISMDKTFKHIKQNICMTEN